MVNYESYSVVLRYELCFVNFFVHIDVKEKDKIRNYGNEQDGSQVLFICSKYLVMTFIIWNPVFSHGSTLKFKNDILEN